MGEVRSAPVDALLFFAIFGQDPADVDAAKSAIEDAFGKITLQGPRFRFDDTSYYARSMGGELWKELVATDRLIPQDELAIIKRATNELEQSIGVQSQSNVDRPINIDPGMVDDGKVMLASTKNHAHRIYQGHGIFAEVTLYLRSGIWEPWPWTYPDYRRPEVLQFCAAIRERYRSLRAARDAGR